MTDKTSTATKIELFGTLRYAKVFEENRDMKGFQGAYEACNGACTLDVLMDKDNADILAKSGSQKRAKLQEDGTYLAKFVRKWEAPFTYGGAPQVARADGTAWDVETDGLIGNGSTGVAYLTVYETKAGNGTRLDGVQVIDHVPFEGTVGGGPRFKDYSKPEGGAKTEEPKAPAKTTRKETSTIDDDEIPF